MSNQDSDLEDDEEEILVYVEFDNFAPSDVFSNENLKLDMIGLDSDHPVMQVNGKFFEGTYENAPGTYLFFEKDNNPTIDDPVFDKIPTLKYFNKTQKLLKMQRAFLVPRYEVVGDSEHSMCIPNKETLNEAGVPPKYQEEALSFWNNARNKRLEALHAYLKKQEFRKELRMRGFEPESESDEDNPFAMYKYLQNESEVNDIENEEQNRDVQVKDSEENISQNDETESEKITEASKKLTIIDPGPSTSSMYMPCIEDDVSEEQSILEKVKSVGKGKSKVIKGKVTKKSLKKKKLSEAQQTTPENPTDQSSEIPSANNESSHNSIVENVESNKTDENNFETVYIKTENVETDNLTVEESEELLSKELNLNNSVVDDKKKKKQEKREAKMKEIKERLALQQNFSQPKS